jgi:ComF family protein
VIAAVAFSGRARQVLLGFKYHNRRAIAAHLAGLLVNRMARSGTRADVVTWAPTSPRRRRGRGFDQAELIARQVARQLGVPCHRLLERDGGGDPQTGRGRARFHGPEFRAHPRVPRSRILLVDDVVTTGATLASAAATLRRAGAADVVQAAVAATPAGRGSVQRVVAGTTMACCRAPPSVHDSNVYDVEPTVWSRASTVCWNPISVSNSNGAVLAIPSRCNVSPSGTDSNRSTTFSGRTTTERAAIRPSESVTVSVMR